MKIKILLIIWFIAVLLSSCSHVYSPALYHQDIAYQPKPTSFDTVKSATYVSGGFNAASSNNYSDDKISGEIDLSRGHAFKNFNLAYGAFGSFGDYENSAINKGDANYFTDKFFGAAGGRASANFFVTTGKTDFRIIGVEAAYSHEFGNFSQFRKSLYGQQDYRVDPRTELFTMGLTSEVVFHKRGDINFQQGIRLFVGGTFGNNPINDEYYSDDTFRERLFRNIFPKLSYFIKFKNYFGVAEVGNNFSVRFGYMF